MAAKILLFVLAMSAAAIFADNNIKCDCNDADNEAVWDFLATLSKDVEDLKEEDKDMYSVPPGFLSPLFECNCLEKSRRKREIPLEVASDESPSAESKIERVRALRERKSIHFGSRHCPAGFARIGVLCIKEEFID